MDLALGKRLRELPGPILVTGHTGFKGTWLTLLLERLKVPVIGFALPSRPDALYDRAKRSGAIPEALADIRDFEAIARFLAVHTPSAVIHMAAQPLVIDSYATPRETFEINAMGSANILDASFETPSVEAVLVVTTDKVYRNDNSGRHFVESDPLSGKDPYSASKVGAESAVAAWQQISKVAGGPTVVSVRAGNVIGGGDWSENRLLPDLIRGFARGETVKIRNPESTRPWQHVLDPLNGYLLALEVALGKTAPAALNFGPDSRSMSVEEIVEIARNAWPSNTEVEFSRSQVNDGVEAVDLNLDSHLARHALGWEPKWAQSDAVIATVEWWNQVLNKSLDPTDACQVDIDFLLKSARGLGNS